MNKVIAFIFSMFLFIPLSNACTQNGLENNCVEGFNIDNTYKYDPNQKLISMYFSIPKNSNIPELNKSMISRLTSSDFKIEKSNIKIIDNIVPSYVIEVRNVTDQQVQLLFYFHSETEYKLTAENISG